MRPRQYEGAWAGVEQNELRRLAELEARSSHVALFLALRVRRDRDGWTRDGIRSLSYYAGLSKGAVVAALRWLVARGIIEERPDEPVKGGDRGQASVRPRRAKSYCDWPRDGVPKSDPPSGGMVGEKSVRDAADGVPLRPGWRTESGPMVGSISVQTKTYPKSSPRTSANADAPVPGARFGNDEGTGYDFEGSKAERERRFQEARRRRGLTGSAM